MSSIDDDDLLPDDDRTLCRRRNVLDKADLIPTCNAAGAGPATDLPASDNNTAPAANILIVVVVVFDLDDESAVGLGLRRLGFLEFRMLSNMPIVVI